MTANDPKYLSHYKDGTISEPQTFAEAQAAWETGQVVRQVLTIDYCKYTAP